MSFMTEGDAICFITAAALNAASQPKSKFDYSYTLIQYILIYIHS